MVIKTISVNDLEKIRELQPVGWPGIVEAFTYYIKKPFCYPVKAVCTGELVGVGAAISYNDTGWLAHIIVSEKHRKKGIGGALVDYLCAYLTEHGQKTIFLIATELGYSLYKQAGFSEEMEYAFFEGVGELAQVSAENIIRPTPADKEEILSMDQAATGEERRTLLLDYLDTGYIYRKDRKIEGVYLPELGEGLIIADHEEAGIALLKLRAWFSKKGTLPIENTVGMDFYRDNGFTETKRLKRMIYGKEIKWRPDQVYNRIGGNFG